MVIKADTKDCTYMIRLNGIPFQDESYNCTEDDLTRVGKTLKSAAILTPSFHHFILDDRDWQEWKGEFSRLLVNYRFFGLFVVCGKFLPPILTFNFGGGESFTYHMSKNGLPWDIQLALENPRYKIFGFGIRKAWSMVRRLKWTSVGLRSVIDMHPVMKKRFPEWFSRPKVGVANHQKMKMNKTSLDVWDLKKIGNTQKDYCVMNGLKFFMQDQTSEDMYRYFSYRTSFRRAYFDKDNIDDARSVNRSRMW